MKTIVLDNEMATVWVYPEKKIIHHKFKKFAYGDKFKEIMLTAADAFQKNECNKWLSDDSENSALRPEDRDWAFAKWEPMVIKAGWKHWALILPKLIVGQMNMKKISEHNIKLGINFKAFSNPNEAMIWLEKQ
jgi:hypothetical protein